MNLKHLQKQVRTILRLRPLPVRINGEGERLADCDDGWFVDQVYAEEPTGVQLTNVSTGHTLKLQPDNIKEYRSPDFLLLRCQLIIRPQNIDIEPIFSNNNVFVRIEQQMPELLAEMRNDLRGHPLLREIVALKKGWSYWGKGTEFSYFFEDHPDLLSKLQILCNHGLM